MDWNPFELMKNAQAIQDEFKSFQASLSSILATGSAGAGMVEVTVGGDNVVRSIKISPEIVDPSDTKTLEVLTAAAFNDAMSKLQQRIKEEASKHSQLFNILGNMKA